MKKKLPMLGQIGYVKHINGDKENRIEFLLTIFDYFDGIDYLAKLFCEKYQMQADKKVEGIFLTLLRFMQMMLSIF